MKIQYASDLHLEFRENFELIKNGAISAVGDVLILAGDTFYLNDTIMPHTNFFKWASDNFRQVLLIPGNHEFYANGDILERGDSWYEMIYDNVGVYYNRVVRIDETDFILSTLWSHIRTENEYGVSHGMNDFRQIMCGGHRLTVDDYNAEHQKCLAFIKQSITASDAKHIVVVTHHVPTYKAVAERYIGDSLSDGFATEIGDYIADSRIDYWVYGHSHCNIDTQIGNTKIVSNQMGYVFCGEHLNGFSGNKCFEI